MLKTKDIIDEKDKRLREISKEVELPLSDEDRKHIDEMIEYLTNSQIEELAEKYSIQLSYFKNNFYKNGKGRDETQNFVYSAITQLDTLLRIPGIKSILCNRHNNLNFDEALKNGEITFVCTRRGDLGNTGHKAFGLFFLLTMQNAVLRRPGNEKSRIPHFLYIDEFSDFISRSTEPIFTMYRKYRVGTVITIQSLTQLESATSKYNYKSTILSNCANKILTGGSTPEELDWWSTELGDKREWTYKNNIDVSKLEYDSKYSDIKWAWVKNFAPAKLANIRFKITKRSS